MTAAVFDFPAIASRLRKDDFFTPKAKDEQPNSEGWYQCRECFTVFEPEAIIDGATHCPNCGIFNRCYFP
jgi:hypothetical protein